MAVSTYQVGFKTLLCMAREQNSLLWYRSHLDEALFKDSEVGLYKAFISHIKKYNKLPSLSTLYENYPEFKDIPLDETAEFYLEVLDQRYAYGIINNANVESQKIIQSDKTNIMGAKSVLQDALNRISKREQSSRLVDFGADGKKLILDNYHSSNYGKSITQFYWDYMDNLSGGAVGGDLISFVGRPASGKSFVLFRQAYKNFRIGKQTNLIVSMEMNALSVSQRLAAIATGVNLTQIKKKALATPTYNKFVEGLSLLETEESKLYVLDGNLSSDIEDVYLLASTLNVDAVYLDGAYLLKTNENKRLSPFERVSAVAHIIKRSTSELDIPSICSWQFNRDAVNKKKGGNQKQGVETAGLENIGMTDAIGQLSSIVISMLQEESVETMESRVLTLLKGRDGESGQWRINWDFVNMNFDERTDEMKTNLEYI